MVVVVRKEPFIAFAMKGSSLGGNGSGGWLAGPDKGAGKAADDIRCQLFALLCYDVRQRSLQVVDVVPAGDLQINLREAGNCQALRGTPRPSKHRRCSLPRRKGPGAAHRCPRVEPVDHRE